MRRTKASLREEAHQFIFGEPAGFRSGDTNLTRYVYNSPLTNRDPSGRQAEKLTDKEYEVLVGVFQDIMPGGRMKEDAKHLNGGKPFRLEDMLGMKGYNLDFRFEKAYVGVYRHRDLKLDYTGAYVKLLISLDQAVLKEKYTELRIVQVIREYTVFDGKKSSIFSGHPVRHARSGIANKDAPSRGWAIDRDPNATNPFMDSANHCESGAPGKAAVLREIPSAPPKDTNVGAEFDTIIIGVKPGQKGVPIGYIHWGYYVDKTGKPTFDPAQPFVKVGFPPELRDAVDRWNAIKGNDKLELDFGK